MCRRREQQTAKLRKTAEKLLMAQLKKRALQMNTAQNVSCTIALCKAAKPFILGGLQGLIALSSWLHSIETESPLASCGVLGCIVVPCAGQR